MKKVIIPVLCTLLGTAAAAGAMIKFMEKSLDEARKMSDKHLVLFRMMSQWVQIKQEEKSVAEYLKKRKYHTVAIYGMSHAGQRLLEELKGSGITVKYGIDMNVNGIYADIDIVSPEEQLETVDAVIVTSIYFMDEIEKKLSKKILCPILSLEDILYEL